MVRAGWWYCIEQAVRLNSGKGVRDGYGELWVNGHSVWSTNTAYYRDDGTTTLTSFFANLYHGGMGYSKADIHYRIAKLAVSSQYIGVPRELLTRFATQSGKVSPAREGGNIEPLPVRSRVSHRMGQCRRRVGTRWCAGDFAHLGEPPESFVYVGVTPCLNLSCITDRSCM
jgi:hypothetical protein